MSTGMRKWMENGCPEIQCLPAQVSIDREELKQLRVRLESAEEDRSNFILEMGKLCAQCDALRAALRHEADCVEAAKDEIEALRAKIARMEQQKPDAWCATDETGTVVEALGMNQSRRFDTALYLSPGAKGEEKCSE